MSKETNTSHTGVKPCFPYPGGKTRLLKDILPLIPAHKQYVEPFAGGLAVLLAKPRCAVEVVNDLNKELVNFYRYVRFHPEALMRELERHLCSRADFETMLETPGFTDLQRAVRWYLLKVCSFGGMSEHFGRGKGSYHGFDRVRHLKAIEAVHERLNRVVIENRDWEEVVTFFDDAETFIFFDPPYVEASKTAYAPFNEFEMQRVRDRLDRLQGTWLLTCDDSPTCRRIFEGLPVRQLSVKYSCYNLATTKEKTRKDYHEMLVMSPRLAAQMAAA